MSTPVDPGRLAPQAAIAIDLDAVSTSCVLDRFLRATDAMRAGGTAIIALTTSRRCDVLQAYPGIRSRLDALIYEHGCVVELDGRLYPRARPVPQDVSVALRRSGVPTLSGQVTITARDRGVAATRAVLGAITGVEVVAGSAGAIVIPAGISRRAAIEFVAGQLGLAPGAVREVSSAAALNEALVTLSR